MTFAHALTKSRANFSPASSLAINLSHRAQLRVGSEQQIDPTPVHFPHEGIPSLVRLSVLRNGLPLDAQIKQIHEEVVGQHPGEA